MNTKITIQQLGVALAAEETLGQKARERLRWLKHYCENDCSVRATCLEFGLTPVTVYRVLDRFDPQNPSSLEDRSRRPLNPRTSLPLGAREAVLACQREHPEFGREKIASLMRSERGWTLSPSTVGRILTRSTAPVVASVAPQTLTTSIAASPTPVVAAHQHGCLLCRLARSGLMRPLKRAVLISSVLVNAVLITLLLTTALLESRPASASASLQGMQEQGPTPSSVRLAE